MFYMSEAQQSSKKAIQSGLKVKSLEWINQVCFKSMQAIELFYDEIISELNCEERKVDLLNQLKNNSSDHVKCFIDYHISMLFYKSSIKSKDSDLNKSFRCINECNYYFEGKFSYFKVLI
jgi:hypothetical protein